MKQLFTLSVVIIITFSVSAQAPQKMSYQAVIRNSSNAIVSSSAVGMRVSILQGSPTGTEVYKEIFNPNPQTNTNGLVTIEIGGGIPLTGTFSAIDWSSGVYFIKTEIDPTGGTSYTITGTSQMLSVPYALYAKTSGETDPMVKTINGIVKSNGSSISAATAGIDYLAPTSSAALLTNFPILNQNTTGNAATVTTNANLSGMVTSVGNVTTVVTNAKLTGEVTSLGNVTTVTNLAVNGKLLTGFTKGAGTVTSTDNILQAFQKVVGNTTHAIGDSYGGGIVFYVYDNGQHGLIAATADQSTSMRWYAGTYTNTMAYAYGVGAGKANTAIIIANQGYGDGATYAASVCNIYQVTVGGVTYGDWYLPSKFELNLLYLQKGVVGGFSTTGYYWSSSEYPFNNAWVQYFGGGGQDYNPKNTTNYVRAIRAF